MLGRARCLQQVLQPTLGLLTAGEEALASASIHTSSSASSVNIKKGGVYTSPAQQWDAAHGCAVKMVNIEDEWYNRQRNILPHTTGKPGLSAKCWIAPNAVIVGDVQLHEKANVHFGAVLRGDMNTLTLGHCTSILDRVVIHTAAAVPTGLNASTMLGAFVTVEPYAILRACRVEDKCIIGARSVLCEGSIMEQESILAPNSVLAPARRIPTGELWGGNPARFLRKLTGNERERTLRESAEHYYNMADLMSKEELPYGNVWREVEKYREKMVAAGQYEWVNFREQKYLMKLQHEAEIMARLTH